MKNGQALSFRVRDKLLGEEISPDNVTLVLLSEFSEQVTSFLRGSKRLDLNDIRTRISTGSLVLATENKTGLLDEAFSDYSRAKKEDGIDDIDFVRAQIIEQWQLAAKKNKDRIYELFFEDDQSSEKLIISYTTNYTRKADVWIDVEEYIYGRIFDLGGKTAPNVHLELDNGTTIKVGADASTLVEDKENRLYKKQLVRIAAKQNIRTKELKDERLISFENYNPSFDEDKFMATVKKARIAWRSVKSPSLWVEGLRGNE